MDKRMLGEEEEQLIANNYIILSDMVNCVTFGDSQARSPRATVLIMNVMLP